MSAILHKIETLAASTRCDFDSSPQVESAFLLGLWWRKFPDYILLNGLSTGYDWDLDNIDPDSNDRSDHDNLFKFQFISDTGDSWHQCYRDVRQLGWQRTGVWREGGRLQYLFEIVQEDLPKGYQRVKLLLDISISTCKQVQVGTKMVEQPIFETKCEDLAEEPGEREEEPVAAEAEAEAATAVEPVAAGPATTALHPAAEVIPLVVIDDIDELQRRRSCKDRADAAFQDAQDSYQPEAEKAADDPNSTDDIPI